MTTTSLSRPNTPPPGLTLDQINLEHSNMPSIITTVIITIIAAICLYFQNYTITHISTNSLLTSITNQLHAAFYIVTLQTILVSAMTIQGLLIKEPYWRILPSLASFIIVCINPNLTITSGLILLAASGLIAQYVNNIHTYQEYFRKLSFRLLLPPHLNYLNLSVSLLMALSIYMHSNPDSIRVSINELVNNTANLISPRLIQNLQSPSTNINEYLNKQLQELDIQLPTGSQRISENQFKTTVQEQIQTNISAIINPIINKISPYLQPTISIIALITIYQIIAICSFISIFATYLLTQVLIATHILTLKSSNQPVECLTFHD